MNTALIARLRISLDNVKPTVMRRVEAPLSLTMHRLHLTIQAAMGWTNSHLYDISMGGISWGMPDPDFPNDALDARKARLWEVIEDVGKKRLRYVYDFGDNWQHTVVIERIEEGEAEARYPRLLAAQGRCPPEDCGGPYGFAELREAALHPNHERREEVEFYAEDTFTPGAPDVGALARDVAELARQWSRPSRARAGR